MKNKEDAWKKQKEYLKDPDKPRGYLIGIAGWIPGEKLKLD